MTMRRLMDAVNPDQLETLEAALLQARNGVTHLQRLIEAYERYGKINKFALNIAAEQLEKAAELAREVT